MNALDEDIKTESRPTGIGPGERLQAARIQRGLSLEDVAKRMHLSTNILQAIEENSFEAITAPIFVKGYLRAYARIVALDEDDMIQQYTEFYSEEDPPITSTSNVAHELAVSDARIKSTTYLVILVLLVLLAAWWWNKEKNSEAPISLDSQSSETTAGSAQEATAAASEIEAVSESLLESGESGESGGTSESSESSGTNESSGARASNTEPAATADSADPPRTTAAPAAAFDDETGVGVSDRPGSAAASTSTAAVPSTDSLIAPSGSDKLKVIIHADTWADIKDSSDYQLVYDLLRADQSLELTGAAPFSVFLGNGHGVEILFNDAEVDIASRVRDDNTTRLKIGN